MNFKSLYAGGCVSFVIALCGCSSDAASGSAEQGGQGSSGSGGAGPAVGGEGGAADEVEAPDYATAFPQDSVPTLNIQITPEEWARMLADMTSLCGEFGAGGLGMAPQGGQPNPGDGQPNPGGAQPDPGAGGTPPAELVSACGGLAAGDSCSAALQGTELQGTCTANGSELMCQPTMGGEPGGVPGEPGGLVGGGDMISGTPIYVEASVDFAGRHWQHVGLRFKGNSSLMSSWSGGSYKLPMRLDFDHFEDLYPETQKQRFFGFEHLSLSNGWSDPTLVRDKLGTDIFAEFGVPVPATAFYRVVIDSGNGPVYFGLYTAIELPSDRAFLDRAFGSHEGNLYKPEGQGATWAVFDPATLGKENHEEEADFSDASALFDALHGDRTNAAAFRAGLERRLNVDGFLRWLALNTLIQDWDTYGNMSHNYYLYAVPSDADRFQWIPWDHTFAFAGQDGRAQSMSLDLTNTTDQWPLIRFLLDDVVYAARYRAFVAEAATAYTAFAETHFQSAHDRIAEFVVGANGETAQHTLLSSADAFETAHAALRAHPSERAAAAAAFVGE